MAQSTRPPHIVTLGTAGGPKWWPSGGGGDRAGIATAVVVEDSFYLVDCGLGVGRQLARAGLRLADMRAVFLTHLHSDHTIDLASLAIFGLYEMLDRAGDPVRLLGPGNRGVLPKPSPRAVVPPSPLAPHRPTPGTSEMFEQLMHAHATDLNDRIIDSLRPSPLDLFHATDIEIPGHVGFHPNDAPTPPMVPFTIHEDDLVQVSAILVEHPPIAPAFAFRFETADGSVTISGDTAPTRNMITLAEDTDLLLHEAIDFDWVETLYGAAADPASRAARDHHHKSHTSPRDAARIAREAGAKQLALHHLVPGHADPAVWLSAAADFPGLFHVPQDLDVIEFSRSARTSALHSQLQPTP